MERRDVCFTVSNGLGQCASPCYANAPLFSDAHTIRGSRKLLWPPESLSGSIPARHIATSQTFNHAVTCIDKYAPTTITKAIAHTHPIAINKIAGVNAPAVSNGIYQAPVAKNIVTGEYVYPYKQIIKNAPVHACLAGYDGEIFNIIDDIKRTTGSEIEVHFYLFYKCKFNLLGSHLTTVKNIQDVLARYHHYICLNKKYVETVYKANEHCWYVEKLIVIPGFHEDVDFLHKDLQMQDFNKMCYGNAEPLVIEVEEKYNNLANKEQDNIICLKDISRISNTHNVNRYAAGLNTLQYNTGFNDRKNIFRPNSNSNSNAKIQFVESKYSTPTNLITNYGLNANKQEYAKGIGTPYTNKQEYAKGIGTPYTNKWYNSTPTSTNASFRNSQSNVYNNYICYNSQNSLNNYLSGLNLGTPAPVCKVMSRNDLEQRNSNMLPLENNAKNNFVNIVDNNKNDLSSETKFLPVNSQRRYSVVPASKSTQNVNQNGNRYQYHTKQQTKNRNVKSYWLQNNLYQQSAKSANLITKAPISYSTSPVDKTNGNLLLGHYINNNSNDPSKKVVFKQNFVNSDTVDNVIVTPSTSATTSSNQQQNQFINNIIRNYSFYSDAVHSNISKGMGIPQTKILVYNPNENIWKNVLQTKIIPRTSFTSIPTYSKDALSQKPSSASHVTPVALTSQQNQFVSYVQPFKDHKIQAVQPSQTISLYTPSQSKPQQNLNVPSIQTSQILQVKPMDTVQAVSSYKQSQSKLQQNLIVPCVQTLQTQVKPLTDHPMETQPLDIVSPYASKKQKHHLSYSQTSNILSFDQAHRLISKKQFAPYVQLPEVITSYTPLRSGFTPIKTKAAPQIISSYSAPSFVTNDKRLHGQIPKIIALQPTKNMRIPFSDVVCPVHSTQSLYSKSLKKWPSPTSTYSSQKILIKPSKQIYEFTNPSEQRNSLISGQKSNLLPNIGSAAQYSHGIPQSGLNDPQFITQIKYTPSNNSGSKKKITRYQTTTSDSVNTDLMTSNADFNHQNYNQEAITKKFPFGTHGARTLNPKVNKAAQNKLQVETNYKLKPLYQKRVNSPTAKANPTIITRYTIPNSMPVQFSEALIPSNLNTSPPQDAYSKNTVTKTGFSTNIYASNIHDYGIVKSISSEIKRNNNNIVSEFTPKTKTGQAVSVNVLKEQAKTIFRPSQFDTESAAFENLSGTPMTITPPYISPFKETSTPNIGFNNYIFQQASTAQKKSPNILLPFSCIDKRGLGYNVWFIPSHKVSNSMKTAVNIPGRSSRIRVSPNVDYTLRQKPIISLQRPNDLNLQPFYVKKYAERPRNAMSIKFSPCAYNLNKQNSINTFDPLVCGKGTPAKENIKTQPIAYQNLDKQKHFIPVNLKKQKVYDKMQYNTTTYNDLQITYEGATTNAEKLRPYKVNSKNIDVINSYTNVAEELPKVNLFKTDVSQMFNKAPKVSKETPITDAYPTISYTPQGLHTNVYESAEFQELKSPTNIPLKTNGKYICINSYDSAKATAARLRGIPVVKQIQPLHVSVNFGKSNSPARFADLRSNNNKIISINVANQQKIRNQFVKTVSTPQINANKEIYASVKPILNANKYGSAKEEKTVRITNDTPNVNKFSTAFKIPSWDPNGNKLYMVYGQRKDASKSIFVKPIDCLTRNYQQRGSSLKPTVVNNKLNDHGGLYMPKRKHEYFQIVDSYSNPKPKFANVLSERGRLKILPNSSQLPINNEGYKTHFKQAVYNPTQIINIPRYTQPCTDQKNKFLTKIIPNMKPENNGEYIDIQSYTKSPDTLKHSSTTTCTNTVIPTCATNPILRVYPIPRYDKFMKTRPRQQVLDKFSTVSRLPISKYQSYIPNKNSRNESPVQIFSYNSPSHKLLMKTPLQPTNSPISYKPYKKLVTLVQNTKEPGGICSDYGPQLQGYTEPINIDKIQQGVNKPIMQSPTRITESHKQPKKDEKYINIDAYTDGAKQGPDNAREIKMPHQQFRAYADPGTKNIVTLDGNAKAKYTPMVFYYNPVETPYNRKKPNKYITVQLKKENNIPVSQHSTYVKPSFIEKYSSSNEMSSLEAITPSYNTVSYKPQSICDQKLITPSYNTVSYKPQSICDQKLITPSYNTVSYKPQSICDQKLITPSYNTVSYKPQSICDQKLITPSYNTVSYKPQSICDQKLITPSYNTVSYKPQSICDQKLITPSYNTVSYKPQSICDQKLSPPAVNIYSYSVPSTAFITISPSLIASDVKTPARSAASIFTAPDTVNSYTVFPEININKYYATNNKYGKQVNKVSEKGPSMNPFNIPVKTAEKNDFTTTYSEKNNNVQPIYETIPTSTKPGPIMKYLQAHQTNNPKKVFNVISADTTLPKTVQIHNIRKPEDFNQIKVNTVTSIKKPICQEISYTKPVKTPDELNDVQYIDWFQKYRNAPFKNRVTFTPSVGSVQSNEQRIHKQQFQVPFYMKNNVLRCINLQVYHNDKQNNAAYVLPSYTKPVPPCNVKSSIRYFTEPVTSLKTCYTKKYFRRPQILPYVLQYKPQYDQDNVIESSQPSGSQRNLQNIPYCTTKKETILKHPLCLSQTVISNVPYNSQMTPWSIQQSSQTVPYYTVKQNPTIVRNTPLESQMVTANILYDHPKTKTRIDQAYGLNSINKETTNIMYEKLPQKTPIATVEKVQTDPHYTAVQKDASYKPCIATKLYQNPRKKPLNGQRKQVLPCYSNTQTKVTRTPNYITQLKPAYALIHRVPTIPDTFARAINVPYYSKSQNALYQQIDTPINVIYNQNQRNGFVCTTPIYTKPSTTQDIICQAPNNASSYIEVQKFVSCIQHYIQQYMNTNQQFEVALKNLFDDPNVNSDVAKDNITPLKSMSLLDCNFGDRKDFTVTNVSNVLEIRKFVNKVKVIKPKLVFETEQIEVPNFVPVLKGYRHRINNDQIQNYIRNKLIDKYSVVVVKNPCPKSGKCVVNWDTRQGRKAVIWPSRFENK